MICLGSAASWSALSIDLVTAAERSRLYVSPASLERVMLVYAFPLTTSVIRFTQSAGKALQNRESRPLQPARVSH